MWSARSVGGAAVGDDEGGRVGQLEHPVPELPLGLDVECAGQVVEDEQLRLPDEHAGGGGALHLSS